MDSFSICNWNARGFNSNGRHFRKLIEEIRPSIICVQESFLKTNSHLLKLSGYETVRLDNPSERRRGLITFIDSRISFSKLSIQHDSAGTEILGIQVKADKLGNIHIFNVYNPPAQKIDQTLSSVAKKFPRNTIFVGDFNAHDPLWGSPKTDQFGTEICKWIDDNDLCVLNTGEGTHLTPSGELTHIDLSISSRNLAAKASFHVIQEPCGSDHLPVLTTFSIGAVMEEVNLPRRFIYDKADWGLFSEITSRVTPDNITNDCPDTYLNNITGSITEAAEESIPRTKGSTVRRPHNPAWTDRCTEARKSSRRAFKQFKRKFISHQNYNATCNNTKKVIAQEAKSHWQNYVSTLNKDSNIRDVWRKIGSLNNKRNFQSIPTLGTAVTSAEKANILARHFGSASSNDNLDPTHAQERLSFQTQHGRQLADPGPDSGPLNVPFTLHELHDALNTKKDTATGKDNISYNLIKHLHPNFKNILLTFYNTLFVGKQFPSEWREAIVIPLPKPGKDKHDPSSYRPISLTSHLCKVMETMLNNRLKWFLDREGILDSAQSGFRAKRSTIDHLVRLETRIRCAMAQKQFTGAVFLDISKAFDLVWHSGLLHKLKNIGISGSFLSFIGSFLLDRKIQVRVNSSLSDKVDLDNGTPQGSVLSPTLFNIMANDLADLVEGDEDPIEATDLSQFADDNQINNCDRNIKKLTRRLQNTLDTISDWSVKWGFKLSQEKTVAVLFGVSGPAYRQAKQHFKLHIRGTPVQVQSSAKFLGLTFDQHLSFNEHINNVVQKCNSAINLMKAVSGTSFGADKPTLLMLYKALVRSKIEYGCQAYKSATKTALKRLTGIQYTALRIALGALHGTKHSHLLIESGELPLTERMLELSLRYWTRCQETPDHPCHDLIDRRLYVKVYEKSVGVKHKWDLDGRGPFGYTIYKHFSSGGPLSSFTIGEQTPPAIPPWLLHRPLISTEIADVTSKSDLPDLVKVTALEVIDRKYQGHARIYTDGSKNPDSGLTGASVFDPTSGEHLSYRCTDHLSIYSTELIAINEAIDLVKEYRYPKSVILSDSLSALVSLRSRQSSRSDLVNSILQDCHLLARSGCKVSFEWVPAHVGIHGNETADKLAKAALSLDDIDCDIHLSARETFPHIKKLIMNNWHHALQNTSLPPQLPIPKTLQAPPKYHSSGKYDRIITRLRLNQTKLNGELGQYIFNRAGTCRHCNSQETTEHYLLHCNEHATHRFQLLDTLRTLGTHTLTLPSLLDPHTNIKHATYSALIQYITDTNMTDQI